MSLVNLNSIKGMLANSAGVTTELEMMPMAEKTIDLALYEQFAKHMPNH